MGTELFIKPYGASSYSQADLEAGIPMAYTYNILDIRTPSKRNAHGSNEIIIPGTKANNILFQNIFEIGIDDSYNANKKAEVYVLQDSIPTVPYGILQLLSIKRDKQNLDKIEYECVIMSGLEDLYTAIGEDDLTALDMSAYDHSYTAAVQATSWSASIGVGYVYPMIDYTGRNRAVALSNYDAWYVDEFLPAIYLKYYWDMIFEYAGKTYTSDFIDLDLFKRIAIPFNKETYQFTDADIIAREFRALSTSPQSHSIGGTAIFDNDSSGTAYDPSNIFNTSNYDFTVASGYDGYYSFEVSGLVSYRVDKIPSGSVTATANGIFYGGFQFQKWNGSAWVNHTSANFNQAFNNADVFAPGVDYYQTTLNARIDRIFLKAGEKIRVKVTNDPINPSLPASTTVSVRVAGGAYFQCFFINEFTEGVGLALNNCIPTGVKMKDFLNSIVQMFHLYVDVDPDNEHNYIIEPRDDYYTTDVVDWSAKLDYEKGLEIIPMSDLQGKEYQFKYKPDKDYYNEQYQARFSHKNQPRTYGDKYIPVDNDFVKGVAVNELIFSPTPSVGNDSNTRVIPAMFAVSNGTPEYRGTNLRILYWGGMKTYTGRPWVHMSRTAGTYTSYVNTYPYIGHLDDPFNPTLDLSFGMPKEVNWNIRRQNYTDGNLYNKYHRRFVEEITDPDSRMVTGYFLLTALDIFKLSFRKLYFFHNEIYRLHSVNDYDLAEYKLVKCEFLKVKDPGVYSVSSLPIYGGGDSVWNGDTLPDVAFPKPHNDNIKGISDSVVTGTENYVHPSAAGVVVIGTGNIVGAHANGIFIQGNNNNILSGVSNVYLANSSDLEITVSDVTYINGCLVDGCVAVVAE